MRRLFSTTCVLLTLGIILARPAMAQEEPSTANTLLKRCMTVVRFLEQPTAHVNMYDVGFCLGMMHTLLNFDRVYLLVFPQAQLLYCLPDGITNGQAARVVVKYLQQHPEDLHEPATVLAVVALHDAYPCSGARTTQR